MGNIHKLTKDGFTLFPATTTDAVVHPQVRASLSNLINEYNVSNLYPTSGVNNTNEYSLQGAISLLSSKLNNSNKQKGVKIIFIDHDKQEVQEWKFIGPTFTNTSSWSREDFWYSDFSEDFSDLEDNLANDVLRKSHQNLSDSELTSVKNNLKLEIYAKSEVWNIQQNVNTFINPGIYTLIGYSTSSSDNLPISNIGTGCDFSAQLVVTGFSDLVGQSITITTKVDGTKNYTRTYNSVSETWSNWKTPMDIQDLENRVKYLEDIINEIVIVK